MKQSTKSNLPKRVTPESQYSGEIEGLESVWGYFVAGTDFLSCFGFYKDKLVIVHRCEMRPATVRQCLEWNVNRIPEYEAMSLDIMSSDPRAQAKFAEMTLAALA